MLPKASAIDLAVGPILQRLEGGHIEPGAAAGEAFGHLGRLAAQKLYVEHDSCPGKVSRCGTADFMAARS